MNKGSQDGDPEWRKNFRPDIPSVARIYDYLLGGKDNYPADRRAAERLLAAVPDAREFARENRAFLKRAVRYLVRECAVRQIIDIGTGIPAEGNVIDVALDAAPGTRVVCVDFDPVVLAHGRDLLHGVENAVIVDHDLRRPAELLRDPELRSVIDFRAPVAVLLVAVMHFVADEDDPAGIIRRLLEPFPSGSYVALSHATTDSRPESVRGERVFDEANVAVRARGHGDILAWLAGLDLIPPGLVWAPLWHPDAPPPADPGRSHVYAGIARKP